jgi:hypothetical protein
VLVPLTVILATEETRDEHLGLRPAGAKKKKKKARPYLKNIQHQKKKKQKQKQKKQAGRVAQMVEHLPRKHEALNSNLNTTKNQ